MFKKIKLLFYHLGILKLNTLEEKISYLLLRNISFYNITNLTNKTEIFTEVNIKNSIQVYKEYNLADLKTAYYSIRSINYSTVYSKTYAEWCSENGHVIPNLNIILNLWLKEAYKLNELYSEGIKDMDKTYYYSNSRKLKPYIINITIIVDNLVSIYINQLKEEITV